jgi:hypothetical protein
LQAFLEELDGFVQLAEAVVNVPYAAVRHSLARPIAQFAAHLQVFLVKLEGFVEIA